MSAVLIPVQAVPDQTVQVYLGSQSCTIRLYQRRYGYFADLYMGSTILRRGMEALNLVKIIRDDYLGFTGNLYFFDTQGTEDPTYTGVGSRFVLLYDPAL